MMTWPARHLLMRRALSLVVGSVGCQNPIVTAPTTPPGGGLVQLVLVPASVTLQSGQGQQFTASGRSSNGGSVAVSVTYTAAGGTITPSGLYTAGSAAGNYWVYATQTGGTLRDSAAVSVTAPPSPVSGCTAPQPWWIWCDDFEQNRLGSYYEYGNAGGTFVPVAGAGRNGGTAMRAHFAVGTVSAGYLHLALGKTPGSYFKPVDAGTAVYRELYWRFYFRIQPGWIGGAADKLTRGLSFVDATTFNSVAYVQLWGAGASKPNFLALDPASGTDAAGNIITTGWNDFAHMRWLGAKAGVTPLFDTAHAGGWYCIEVHARLNDPGLSNGGFEYWINGVLDAQETGLNWVGAYQTYGLNAVWLENYWNQGSPAAQDRYFDDFVVSTQRIGC